MSEVLSQDEINALLAGVGGDDAAPAEGGADGVAAADGAAPTAAPLAAVGGGAAAPARRMVVQALDLMKQERSVKGRLPGLEMIVEQFSRQIRAALAGVFGKPPTITVSALEQLRFGPVQQGLQAPMGIHLFRLAPLRGQGMLVLPPEFLTAVIQVSFGGDAKLNTPMTRREFSGIETMLLQKFGDKFLGFFRDCWRQVEPIECTRVRTETNPIFASIAGAQDIVLVIELRLEGDGLDNVPITVILPNASLDPIRARLGEIGRSMEEDEGDDHWAQRLQDALAEVEVEIAAELGRRWMPMRDVLDLQVGDLLTLGTGREGPVLVKVAGAPRFVGAPGVSGGNNAVQITSVG